MSAPNALKPVAPQPGKPLYQTVREAIRKAIDEGVFKPDQQLPSTKELSDQLQVSLVTAHRALQELVAAGVLYRAQGKGTFVKERYVERGAVPTTYRLGLVFREGVSLADYYHSQVLEGVYQAATSLGCDLILLRFGEDLRNECNAYLFVNPLPQDMDAMLERSTRKQPVLVLGATSTVKGLPSLDVDNADLAAQAVHHLASQGHTHLGYVGGTDELSNARDRWRGFKEACAARNLHCPADSNVVRVNGFKLDDRDMPALTRMLSGPRRPTAIFAAGYFFALNVYSAAATLDLKVPDDLSVVGVDDPPSAAYLWPPLTTVRQPLTSLGQSAVTALYEYLHHANQDLQSRAMKAELMIRRSTAPK